MSRHDRPIKEQFSIQDLENLSGIKAHTIRIWEKRYGLLMPKRDANNIRFYCTDDLRKILNVAALIRYGFRISAIAGMSEEELTRHVSTEARDQQPLPHALSEFKLAMMTFDQAAFDRTFAEISQRIDFPEIWSTIFIPLLGDIGTMWQTGTIHIGHEHFVSNLIKQKLLLQIEKQAKAPTVRDRTFVLFLPANEVHELGLLYVHYELLAAGRFSVYLGPSVPVSVLKSMKSHYPDIEFVTWLTVEPADEEVLPYLETVSGAVLRPGQDRLWVMGRKTEGLMLPEDWTHVRIIRRPGDLLVQAG